jgi:hypothetical protein
MAKYTAHNAKRINHVTKPHSRGEIFTNGPKKLIKKYELCAVERITKGLKGPKK